MQVGTGRPTMTRRMALGLLGTMLVPAGPTAAATTGPSADADRTALVTGNSEFGLDLYARLSGGRGNAFFSPYSVSTALAMTYVGARGATADQMAKTLRFRLPPARTHVAFATLIRAINGEGKKRASELYTATGLWSQKGYPFVPDFQRTTQDSYGAALEEVDFRNAPETARRTINAWVERQTQDRIKDLVREGLPEPDTVLVLTNAIYFKGPWAYRFAEERTTPGDFTLAAGGTAPNVSLMRQRERLRYLDGGDFQVLELPYGAGEMAMLVALPRRADGLPQLEKTLSASRVSEWLSRMALHQVDVTLPRFRMTAEAELREPLGDLGMPLVFSPGLADFSGMVKNAVKKRVHVSHVIHKAFVDVNEKGTEAAAATAVSARLVSAHLPEGIEFRADRPFFFLIRDTRTGSILFAGRLTDPWSP